MSTIEMKIRGRRGLAGKLGAAGRFSIRSLIIACGFAGLSIAMQAKGADQAAYPNKPLTLVVPLGAGGINDIISRLIGQKLSEKWKQSVVILNKPGAGGIIGSEYVAKATPDGYTILMVYSSHPVNPSIYAKLPYDTIADFAPITMVNSVNLVLEANPTVPVNSVKDLIALAKAKPGTINNGIIGIGSLGHLAAVLFAKDAGIQLVHVPYKSAPEVTVSLLNGDASTYFDSTITAMPYIKSGKVKALAVTSAKRSPALPNLPTIAEAGIPGYEVLGWNGLVAPAKTPAAVISKLNADVVEILRAPDVVKLLGDQGVDLVGDTPDHFSKVIRDDVARWAALVKSADIRAQQ